MMYRYFQAITFFFSLLAVTIAHAKDTSAELTTSAGTQVRLEKVVEGLSIPWGMVFISSSEILVTERKGNVSLFDLNNSKLIKINNTPAVMAEGQGGMLDVAIPPNYSSSGWIYFTYVKEVDGQGATVLARAKLEKDYFINWQELLVSNSATEESQHFGSRIAFDDEGHVYFGIGDRGERPNSQDLTNHAGTIMRLNLDGSVPGDNPFIDHESALPEIWSYGHRNPQGLSYDFQQKRLWEIEHGPRGGDEINLIQASLNYGWPIISYGKEYWGPLAVGEGTHREGMQQPVKVFTPSIAPGSLLIYSGDVFPNWKGNLFSGALKLRHLNRIVLDTNGKVIFEERLLQSLNERIRALALSPEQWIYFSTDSGTIFRIRPIQ